MAQSRSAEGKRGSTFSPTSPWVRTVGVGLCLLALGLAWWGLASGPTPDRILGRYTIQDFAVLAVLSYGLVSATYLISSRAMSPSKLANCILPAVGMFVAVGMLELPAWLGMIDYRRVISLPQSVLYTKIKPWNNPANLLDPELIHIHRPGQRFAGETVGDLVFYLGIATDQHYYVDIQYDQNGFRNDPPLSEAPVAAFGDSFLEAGLVDQASVVTSQLAQRLRVPVANLGQAGYGPQQELITLRRFGLALHPKLVLWFFFEGNDLLDVARYESMTRDWAATVNGLNGFPERSFTRNALWALAGYTSPKLTQDTDEARKRSCRVQTGSAAAGKTIYFAYPGEPLSADDLTSLDKTEEAILQAQKTAQDNGAALVLIYIPIKYRVYRDDCLFPQDGYGNTWILNDLPTRLESWSEAHGLDYFDLTPALREAAATGDLVYFPDDGHWNARGNEVAARAVDAYLRGNPKLLSGLAGN